MILRSQKNPQRFYQVINDVEYFFQILNLISLTPIQYL